MNIRRYYIPNAIIFITQVVDRREPVFREPRFIDLLRAVLNNVKELHPFAMLGVITQPQAGGRLGNISCTWYVTRL